MNSIFNEVFAYRPHANRSPKEDFFTQALAGILRADLSLRVAFVEWLTGQEVDSVHIDTQKTVAGGDRLDVWFDARKHSGERHVIAMENKIAAREGHHQLERYEKHLRGDTAATTRTLVYATLHERSHFEPSCDQPVVIFRSKRWFEVAEWLRTWTTRNFAVSDSRGKVLVQEVLLLMEDWNMAMQLNADELAAATVYQRTVGPQLCQILDEIKGACDLAGKSGNAWSHNREELWYTSPWVDKKRNIYVEFGFDFSRDDADWNVAQLRLPSAYFAAMGEKQGDNRLQHSILSDWESSPEDWGDGYLRVKRMKSLQIHGNSLHGSYLDFFLTARDELWQALAFS